VTNETSDSLKPRPDASIDRASPRPYPWTVSAASKRDPMDEDEFLTEIDEIVLAADATAAVNLDPEVQARLDLDHRSQLIDDIVQPAFDAAAARLKARAVEVDNPRPRWKDQERTADLVVFRPRSDFAGVLSVAAPRSESGQLSVRSGIQGRALAPELIPAADLPARVRPLILEFIRLVIG
jgi:hypothetical protein